MDEKQFYKDALKTKDPQIAKEAIKKISNQILLMEIAKKAMIAEVGIAAVQSITEEELLARVAGGLGTMVLVSISAVEKITELKYLNKLSNSTICLQAKYIINDRIADLASKSNKITSFKSSSANRYLAILFLVVAVGSSLALIFGRGSNEGSMIAIAIVSLLLSILFFVLMKKGVTRFVQFSDQEVKIMDKEEVLYNIPYTSLSVDLDILPATKPLNTDIITPYKLECLDNISGKTFDFMDLFKGYGSYSVARQINRKHTFIPLKIRFVLVRRKFEDVQYATKTSYNFSSGFTDFESSVNWSGTMPYVGLSLSFSYSYSMEKGFTLKPGENTNASCCTHPILEIQKIPQGELNFPAFGIDTVGVQKIEKEINVPIDKYEALVVHLSSEGYIFTGVLIPFYHILASHPENFSV